MGAHMKISINHKLITNSPYESDISKTESEIIFQLKQQIINGNPTCVLVSGYRGTGKTTLICKLEKELKSNPKVIFVHLNFNKYEKYTLVLRKLIREVFISLSKNEDYKNIRKEIPDVIQSIELLFDRTFFDISYNSNTKKSKDSENSFEINIDDIKKFAGVIGSLVITAFNFKYDFISLIPKYSNIILFIVSCFLTTIQLVKVGKKVSVKESSSDEINRKSLYDDEIAETRIKNVLNDLKSKEYKIVIVLDELDKIENDSEIEQLISELKPIMLSNLASFIIVSGQKLYYKFTNSNTIDDSVISSIFSKQIHISLLSRLSFDNVFKAITNIEDFYLNELVRFYIDSLVLNSNRTVRRFFNLISQDIIWENDIAYLIIDDDQYKVFETDSKLLNVLSQIEQEQIEIMDYSEGIKDFFIIQLHLWIQKIKLKGKMYFSKENIYNFDKDYSGMYPTWCSIHLNTLCGILLEEMCKISLLEKKTEEIDSDENMYYKWTEQANIKSDNTVINEEQVKAQFLLSVVEIEKCTREICVDLFEEYTNDNIKLSLRQLIEKLISANVLVQSWKNEYINNIIDISDNIRHGKNVDYSDIGNKNLENRVRMLLINLFESFSYFVSKRYLENHNYSVTREAKFVGKDNKFFQMLFLDILAISSEKNVSDIIFEVKYKNQFSSSDEKMIYRMLDMLIRYNEDTKKMNRLVVFWYSKESRRAFEQFYNKFHIILSERYPDLKDYIHLFYASEHRTQFCSSRLEEYLEKIVEGKT